MRWILILMTLGALLSGCAHRASQDTAPGNETNAGRKIYYAKCAKCHKFYDPAKYSDGEWSMWMQKMKKKAKLSDEQEKMLSEYIETVLRGK